MRKPLEKALGIDKPTPGRVYYDPLKVDIPDMRKERIPPKAGSYEAWQLNEVGV